MQGEAPRSVEVSVEEIKQAQQHFEVASVQNKYAVDNREWETVLEYCKEHNIAFIPWFPIGGGQIAGEEVLQTVATKHGVSTRQVALSWLLHHADNILLIPGPPVSSTWKRTWPSPISNSPKTTSRNWMPSRRQNKRSPSRSSSSSSTSSLRLTS